MFLLILGPPGSGKGTQGQLLAQRFGIPKIATGDLLREAVAKESELGKKAKKFMDQGKLVPDELIMDLIREQLATDAAQKGAIFDGFPRTNAQAQAVDRLLTERRARVTHVLLFDVPEEEIIQRLVRRANIEGRSDDNLETIQHRLQVYQQATAPLIAYYGQRGMVHRVPAVGDVHEVADRVKRILGK